MTPHYIIHQAARADREANMAALALLPYAHVVEPVPHASPMVSCALTHQEIISRAVADGNEAVAIYEDDVLFKDQAALSHWLTLVRHFHAEPNGIDVLLGGVSVCNGEQPYAPGLVEVKGFSATHCYCVKASGYEAILAKSPRNHIDGLITETKLRKVVTVPFLATQLAGWSDIRRGKVDDTRTFKNTEERLLKVVRNG